MDRRHEKNTLFQNIFLLRRFTVVGFSGIVKVSTNFNKTTFKN